MSKRIRFAHLRSGRQPRRPKLVRCTCVREHATGPVVVPDEDCPAWATTTCTDSIHA